MEPNPQSNQFAAILRRRIRMIILIGIIGTAFATVAAWQLTPRYTAKAEIVIGSDRSQPVGAPGMPSDPSADEAAILTEVTSLTSHDLLLRVLQSLRDDPAFGALMAPPQSSRSADADAANGSGWLVKLWHTSIGATRQQTLRLSNEVQRLLRRRTTVAGGSPIDAYGLTESDLLRNLKIFQERGSRVVAVSYTSTNPRAAAMIANRVVTVYLAAQMEQLRAASDRTLAGLDQKVTELKKDVGKLDASVVDYQRAHELADASRRGVVDEKLGDLNKQLSEAQSDLAARKARRQNLLALQQGTPDWSALLLGLDAQGLVNLHGQLMALLDSRADTIVPPRGRIHMPPAESAALDPMVMKLRKELDQAIAKLNNDEAVAAARVDSIRKGLAAVQTASDDPRLAELIATASSARHRYERILQRREDALEQRDELSPTAHLLSLAPVPDRPSSANPILFIPPATIAFLILGSFIAIVSDSFDRAFRTESDIVSALGIGCSAMVPRLRGLGRKRPHEYLLEMPYTSYAESIRSIMAGLYPVVSQRQPAKAILITSSIPGEGKTTVALSLATYAARSGLRVLLLDFDFRKGSASRELGGTTEKGDLMVLTNRHANLDIVQDVAGLNFDYLPLRCGMSADALPIIASGAMATLLQRLRLSYDYVIIDSAPILAVAETQLLANMVDRILFVVRWGETRRNEAQNALRLIRAAVPEGTFEAIARAVVTQVDVKRHARGRYGDRGDVMAKYASYYTPVDRTRVLTK